MLSDYNAGCVSSNLDCYLLSGPYLLNQYYFDNVNPYLYLIVSPLYVLSTQ